MIRELRTGTPFEDATRIKKRYESIYSEVVLVSSKKMDETQFLICRKIEDAEIEE